VRRRWTPWRRRLRDTTDAVRGFAASDARVKAIAEAIRTGT
jgi:hypothetical protein